MSCHRQYDTVAFDVRENALMLFFARTTASGDIDDYLLLMRAVGEDYDPAIYLEVNEQQLAGHNLIREAHMAENMLTLVLHEPVPALDNSAELILSYDATADNRHSVEQGVFRVLGDCLEGGHA